MDRRLAAILAADIAGYSRLIGDAEEQTVRALQEQTRSRRHEGPELDELRRIRRRQVPVRLGFEARQQRFRMKHRFGLPLGRQVSPIGTHEEARVPLIAIFGKVDHPLFDRQSLEGRGRGRFHGRYAGREFRLTDVAGNVCHEIFA